MDGRDCEHGFIVFGKIKSCCAHSLGIFYVPRVRQTPHLDFWPPFIIAVDIILHVSIGVNIGRQAASGKGLVETCMHAQIKEWLTWCTPSGPNISSWMHQ